MQQINMDRVLDKVAARLADHDAELDQYWADVKVGKKQVMCRVGYHHGKTSNETCELCTAEAIEMMTFTPDNGPWTVSDDGCRLYSDDFRHDVTLTISGDFFDSNVKKQYAEHIAAILNAGVSARMAAAVAAPTFTVPSGLTPTQIVDEITSKASQIGDK